LFFCQNDRAHGSQADNVLRHTAKSQKTLNNKRLSQENVRQSDKEQFVIPGGINRAILPLRCGIRHSFKG